MAQQTSDTLEPQVSWALCNERFVSKTDLSNCQLWTFEAPPPQDLGLLIFESMVPWCSGSAQKFGHPLSRHCKEHGVLCGRVNFERAPNSLPCLPSRNGEPSQLFSVTSGGGP